MSIKICVISDEKMNEINSRNQHMLPLARSIQRMTDIAAELKAQGMLFEPAPDSVFLTERPAAPYAYNFDERSMVHVYTQGEAEGQ